VLSFEQVVRGIGRVRKSRETPAQKKEKTMELLHDVELVAVSGGSDWGDFLSGLGWTLGVGCGVTLNPAVCGAAVVVSGVALFTS